MTLTLNRKNKLSSILLIIFLLIALGAWYFALSNASPYVKRFFPSKRYWIDVQTDFSWENNPELSSELKQSQMKKVDQIVNKILSDINYSDYTQVTRPVYCSCFIIQANSQIIQKLSKHPLVRSVSEDRLAVPTN